MPEHSIQEALTRTRSRLRLISCLDAMMVGSASASVVAVLGFGATAAAGAFVLAAVVSVFVGWRRWTAEAVARRIETSAPVFDNLLITAREALDGRATHPLIARELYAQASERLRSTDASVWMPRPARRLPLVLGVVAASALLVWRAPAHVGSISLPMPESSRDATTDGISRLRVTITPPAYTRRRPASLENPVEVQALEGSSVNVAILGTRGPVELLEAGREPVAFAATDFGAQLEFRATDSRVLVIREAAGGGAAHERLLHVQVQRDERPVVMIERPGRDLVFGAAQGTVRVTIKAHDDINVAGVALRYTRIAGSGETFRFQEGEIPVQVSTARDGKTSDAGGTIALDRLHLEDGDTLVYRALAHDDKPGADPSTSESFLVEIGRRGEAAGAGFALPDDRDRQALSQQMLIMKTERLHAQRGQLVSEALLEQSRLLGVEQRMVRAEFLFMTGGEVADEVEEAEQSPEIAQGRLENQGQIELLNAIREMSRAEARLNAGDTEEALVFERAALTALQRAFDRRRYFLRTLLERARIDRSRRGSGDLSAARPAAPSKAFASSDPVVQELREAMTALAAARRTGSGLNAPLAAEVIALDPQSQGLQRFAVQLSSGASTEDKQKAAADAERHLADLLRQRLAPAATHRLRPDPLAGALGDELARRGGAR